MLPSNIRCLRGSSPRPWGTPNTPLVNSSIKAVHPHARGERVTRTSFCPSPVGSSPRPWGTRGVHAHERCIGRFIPTPVGNAVSLHISALAVAVHPHARGERSPRCRRICCCTGSSPRPWGTHVTVCANFGGERFIPTPVGNAAWLRAQASAGSVHPHARGERGGGGGGGGVHAGSSPRPWGTPAARARCAPGRRFIPTPVGNARSPPHRRPPRPVHPHARGERVVDTQAGIVENGSSPRPWGTRVLPDRGQRRARFIPTPVGNARVR